MFVVYSLTAGYTVQCSCPSATLFQRATFDVSFMHARDIVSSGLRYIQFVAEMRIVL